MARKVSNARREQRKTEPETWIGVPVGLTGSGLDRAAVDKARAVMEGNRRPGKVGDRFFELSGGLLRCEHCGRAMTAYSRRNTGATTRRAYYRCDTPSRTGADCPNRKSRRAADLEERAWRIVSFEASDPEGELLRRISAAYDDQKRRLGNGDRHRRAALQEGLARIEQRRDGLYDLAADGDIPKEVLRRKLADLAEQEDGMREELEETKDAAEQLAELEGNYRTVLEVFAERQAGVEVEDSPEARQRRYKAMGVAFTVDSEGALRAEWALRSDGRDTETSIGSSTSAGL